MTTQDYEMLDQDPAELSAVIRQYPNTVKSLDDAVMFAMLGYSQAGQDGCVYEPCSDEMHRRGSSEYRSLSERMAKVYAHEAALRDRMATAWGLDTPGGSDSDSVAQGARILTTSAEIGSALDTLETARAHVQAGEPHSVIDAQLYLVFEKLVRIVLRSLDDDEAAFGGSHN